MSAPIMKPRNALILARAVELLTQAVELIDGTTGVHGEISLRIPVQGVCSDVSCSTYKAVRRTPDAQSAELQELFRVKSPNELERLLAIPPVRA